MFILHIILINILINNINDAHSTQYILILIIVFYIIIKYNISTILIN